MLSVSKPSPNRIEISFGGKIDADEMATAIDTFISLAEDVENGVLHYTITDFSWPAMSAVAVKFGQVPKLFGILGRFDKAAVLTDTAWIRTAAEIEGAIIPGLAIKGFALAERDEAEAWLAETATA